MNISNEEDDPYFIKSPEIVEVCYENGMIICFDHDPERMDRLEQFKSDYGYD